MSVMCVICVMSVMSVINECYIFSNFILIYIPI